MNVPTARTARVPAFAAAVVSAAALCGLADCGGSSSTPSTGGNVAPANSVLQLAVGTANVYGDLAAARQSYTGTNIVATFRQASGSSALSRTSPRLILPFNLTGPAGAPAPSATSGFDVLATVDGGAGTVTDVVESFPGGPAPAEIGGPFLSSTLPGGSNVTSFGVSGGVFGYGIEPFNATAGGAPFSTTPYVQPLYSPLGPVATYDPNAFIGWGGPPAFDPDVPVDGIDEPRGVNLGLDVFAGLRPSTAGPYTLVVGGFSASARLNTTAVLPAVHAPVPVPDGAGGARFTVTLPPGVTEAYLQIGDNAADCGSARFSAYTIRVTASGTATLPDDLGSNGGPSLCQGAPFTVQLIGFDYPAYAAAYPNSAGNPAPVLVGPAGQADITISSTMYYSPTPAGAFRRITPSAARPRLARPTR